MKVYAETTNEIPKNDACTHNQHTRIKVAQCLVHCSNITVLFLPFHHERHHLHATIKSLQPLQIRTREYYTI